MEPPSTTLGKFLQSRRIARGWSRSLAARQSGVPVKTLEGWEHGRVSNPGIFDVMRLAQALGVTPEELWRVVLGPHRGGEA